MIALVFFLLPLSYFYAEETLTDDVTGGKDPLDTFFDEGSSSDEEEGKSKNRSGSKNSRGCGKFVETITKAIRSTV